MGIAAGAMHLIISRCWPGKALCIILFYFFLLFPSIYYFSFLCHHHTGRRGSFIILIILGTTTTTTILLYYYYTTTTLLHVLLSFYIIIPPHYFFLFIFLFINCYGRGGMGVKNLRDSNSNIKYIYIVWSRFLQGLAGRCYIIHYNIFIFIFLPVITNV